MRSCSNYKRRGIVRVMVLRSILFCGASAVLALAQGPYDLRVISATKDTVQLAWSAPSLPQPVFGVERKVVGTDTWQVTPVVSTTVTSARDVSIDPYTAYSYRVRILNTGTLSDPSNEVTVGPPPPGFTRILDTPGTSPDPRQFGQYLQLVLDGNGDPMFTYYEWQPNGVFEDSTLYFEAWDRANYRWKTPVTIQKIGDQTHSGIRMPFSLARDAVKGTLAIAYEATTPTLGMLRLATSTDNGTTWNLQTVKTDDYAPISSPAVHINNDLITYAYITPYDVIALVGKPGQWVTQQAGEPATMLQIAGDSEGNPGLTYWTANTDDYTRYLRFWRPGQPPTTVMDTNNIQNDDPDARLAFQGTRPRIVAEAARDTRGAGINDFYLYATAAADKTGGTWTAPVNIRPDGNHSLGLTSLAVTPDGQATAAFSVTGGNTGGEVCGLLKLARTTDLMSWLTCSPVDPALNISTGWAQVAYAGNNRAYVLYTEVGSGDRPNGIYLWRE